MIHFISNAQSPFNCDINVPSNQVNLVDNFNSVGVNITSVNQGAGFQCCGQSANLTCETFTVNTFAGNIAFSITTGQDFNGTNITIHVNDYNTSLNVGEYFCVTGGSIYEVSVCTDATDPFTLVFTPLGAPEIAIDNSNVTIGCATNVISLGLGSGTIYLNSISPGVTGSYNSLFDCFSDCNEVLQFTPISNNPDSITYVS